MKPLFAILFLLSSNLAIADEPGSSEATVTILQSKTSGIDKDEVAAMNDITTMVQNQDIDGAFRKLEPILARCDSSQTSSDKKIVYFEDAVEFLEYSMAAGNKKDLVWIKDTCPSAYKAAAFLYVEKGDSENTLKYLDKAIERAPFWAEPFTERGFLLGKLKNFKAAKAAYEKAIELASAHESSAYVKPLALRGLGIVLIDLGELDPAKAALEESLVLEPNNKLALGELEYIGQLQAKK